MFSDIELNFGLLTGELETNKFNYSIKPKLEIEKEILEKLEKFEEKLEKKLSNFDFFGESNVEKELEFIMGLLKKNKLYLPQIFDYLLEKIIHEYEIKQKEDDGIYENYLDSGINDKELLIIHNNIEKLLSLSIDTLILQTRKNIESIIKNGFNLKIQF